MSSMYSRPSIASAPIPGVDERLRLRAILAPLIVVNLEIVALRIERRIDVAEIDAFAPDLARSTSRLSP